MLSTVGAAGVSGVVVHAASLGTPLQVLPSGLEVPPLSYLGALGLAAAVVAAALVRLRPEITASTVLAFLPWMAAGAAGHVLEQVGAAPAPLEPLLGAPTVYVSTFLVAAAVWAAVTAVDARSGLLQLAVVGGVATLAASALALNTGYQRGTMTLAVPLAALVVATVSSGLVITGLGAWRPAVVRRTGWVGAAVLFGHLLDAWTTALGVDLLGSGERSPIPRTIMDVAATLPTADVVGVGWLFVCVKLGVAVLVLVLLADMVEDDPVSGYTALGLVTAVGLGPGVHNLVLFAAVGAA
jgi:uncharacterized membrane protein